jgi:hypothetical protein
VRTTWQVLRLTSERFEVQPRMLKRGISAEEQVTALAMNSADVGSELLEHMSVSLDYSCPSASRI